MFLFPLTLLSIHLYSAFVSQEELFLVNTAHFANVNIYASKDRLLSLSAAAS